MVHEKRELRSENDDLQNRYDKERYESTAWKKEKERMETKIRELERSCEASTGAQTEQQSQIVKLHSQVRDLRAALDEVNNERSVLQKARVALREELESIKLDHRDTNKPTSEKDIQRMQLENRELERSLEEQEDRVKKVTQRMQKAEDKANSYKIDLGKVQVENSRLDKLNVSTRKIAAIGLLKFAGNIGGGSQEAQCSDCRPARSLIYQGAATIVAHPTSGRYKWSHKQQGYSICLG